MRIYSILTREKIDKYVKDTYNGEAYAALWGFLHLKSELIREAENQKTDKNHRKTVKYGSIFEGEIT